MAKKQRVPIKRIQCPLCDRSYAQEVRFKEHVFEQHGIGDVAAFYVDTFHAGVWPTCSCSVDCTARMTWFGWKQGFRSSKYVRGHNIRAADSHIRDKSTSHKAGATRSRRYREGTLHSWNEGLTKETDARLAAVSEANSRTLKAMYASGERKAWSAGLTSETDPRVAKIAETQHLNALAGKTSSWCKGLTKETDARVAKIAASLTGHSANNLLTEEEFAIRVASISDRFELLSDPREFKSVNHTPLRWRCLRPSCGREQTKVLRAVQGAIGGCSFCHPRGSHGQSEVYDFVKSLCDDAIMNSRSVIKPRELDIWVPSKRLGIEYDGLYIHSKPGLLMRNEDPVKYAQCKFEMCQAAGVRFISIFEDEWRDRRPIVEGMIRHRLGLQPHKLDARKLSVRRLKHDEARVFFDANHLEGYARSTASFGLCAADGSIIAAVSLRTPLFNRYLGLLELSRACCKIDLNVRGWLGKLSSAARDFACEQGKLGVTTYVDSRVGAGNAYASAGWVLVDQDTGSRFWWTDFFTRANRSMFNSKNQEQAAAEAGFVPIYGCSNSRWELLV